uniref:Envelope glycoprotein gp130 n=1 Tax=Simian foamy virus TaxID=11642 RepID=A0A6J3YNU2_9RETR|nr:envelope [Simian foamy virus]
MAPPMTIQQWLIWNKMQRAHQALKGVQSLTPEEKQDIILEIQNDPEDIQPTKMDHIKYLLYAACATTSRILGWMFVMCILLMVVIVSCFVTISRIQWNKDIQVLGPVIDWNVSQQAVIQPVQMRRLARSLRAEHPVLKYVEVNMTGIPQGVLYQPHPEPIIVKERVLGLSQVIMINTENIANFANITQEAKTLLVDVVREEMKGLSEVMLDFEIPLGDPRNQEQYIHRKCYQEFAHCYVVKYKEPKPWPTEGILADQCPLPGYHDPPFYAKQAIWDYYAKMEIIRPQNWTSSSVYGTARLGSFYVPLILRTNITHVMFCSDELYGKWYSLDNTIQQNEKLLTSKLTNLSDSQGRLKERALPPDWAKNGQSRVFRNFSVLDVCNRPEAVILLNSTYYTFSLWQGDCNITNITEQVNECKNFYSGQNWQKMHPYACRFWRYKNSEEKTLCNGNVKRCLYYPLWDSPEAMFDFGFLAYLGHFPGPRCIEETKIRNNDYEVYSLYAMCKENAKDKGIDTVVYTYLQFLNSTGIPVQEMPKARAFVGLQNPKFPPEYINVTKEYYQGCIPDSHRRKRATSSNIEKLRSMGYALTGGIQTVSQISDMNDINLQQGVYMLRDHVVTLLEATLHDISIMEAVLAIQHVHTHLTQLKLMLMERRIDWTFLDSEWIQRQLQKSADEMKVIRRTAKSLVHYVKETSYSKTATSWEIGIYYEIIIPKHIYLNNWQIINIGHLLMSAGQLTHIQVQHPYEIINKECSETQYLHLIDCVKEDYVICEEAYKVQPCGNDSVSTDCPVTAEKVKEPYIKISSLKNGSYLILASSTDCQIPPFVPSVVTVNETVTCFGVVFKPPLKAEEKQNFIPQVPSLSIRLPHLTGIIAKLKGIKIEITSTQENIKDQIERATAELLRLDIHEGDTPQWIRQLADATQDVWPGAASVLRGVGNFLSDTAKGIFGTAFSLVAYVKPILIGIGVIILLVVIFKIISWIPIKAKKQ